MTIEALTQKLHLTLNAMQTGTAIGHSAQRHGLRIARHGLLWRACNDGRTPQVA